MSYDPEFNLNIEKQLEHLRELENRIEEIAPEGLFPRFSEFFEIVEQVRNDYDNCFDEIKKEKISKEICDMVKQIGDFHKEVDENLSRLFNKV